MYVVATYHPTKQLARGKMRWFGVWGVKKMRKSDVYCVGVVWTKNDKYQTVTSMYHGIVNAHSEGEALGQFLLTYEEEHKDFVITSKSVFRAYGYTYSQKLYDKEQREKVYENN